MEFPKTLFVEAGGTADDENGTGPDYFGKESVDQMSDGDGARDGAIVAVYELREVKVVRVSRVLITEEEYDAL